MDCWSIGVGWGLSICSLSLLVRRVGPKPSHVPFDMLRERGEWWLSLPKPCAEPVEALC